MICPNWWIGVVDGIQLIEEKRRRFSEFEDD